MARAHASSVIDAPIEQVWRRIRDFNALADWHPGIANSKIEGGKPSDQVGCVRVLTLQDGATMREQLLEMSDLGHHYSYPRGAAAGQELPRDLAPAPDLGRQPHLRRLVGELRSRSPGEAGRGRRFRQQRSVPGRLRRAEEALPRLIGRVRAQAA